MAHKNCDNQANIECPLGEPEEVMVWRWADEPDHINQETLCGPCAADIRHGAETGEIILIWVAAVTSEGILV